MSGTSPGPTKLRMARPKSVMGPHDGPRSAPGQRARTPRRLHWYLSTSPVNFSRHKDAVLDDLFIKQSRAIDPEERRRALRAFEKRLYAGGSSAGGLDPARA